MLRTIIIEDEKPAARRLERMLNRNVADIEIVVKLQSVEESILWLSQNAHPDLIFLDIQLSDGISFEIFEDIDVDSAIIFTTAYDQYALKAFKLNSIDYLLKPIDEDELQLAITKFRNQTGNNKSSKLDIDAIKQLIQGEEKEYKKRFTIKVGQHLRIVDVNDIECIYSEEKGTYVYLDNNKTYLLDGSLEEVFAKLNPKQFYRVSRKFVVNIKHIKDIISYTNSRLQIKLHHFNDDDIIVSREKVKDFKNWLE